MASHITVGGPKSENNKQAYVPLGTANSPNNNNKKNNNPGGVAIRRIFERPRPFQAAMAGQFFAAILFTVGFVAPAWYGHSGLWLECRPDYRMCAYNGAASEGNIIGWMEAVRGVELSALLLFLTALCVGVYQDWLKSPHPSPPNASPHPPAPSAGCNRALEVLTLLGGVLGLAGLITFGIEATRPKERMTRTINGHPIRNSDNPGPQNPHYEHNMENYNYAYPHDMFFGDNYDYDSNDEKKLPGWGFWLTVLSCVLELFFALILAASRGSAAVKGHTLLPTTAATAVPAAGTYAASVPFATASASPAAVGSQLTAMDKGLTTATPAATATPIAAANAAAAVSTATAETTTAAAAVSTATPTATAETTAAAVAANAQLTTMMAEGPALLSATSQVPVCFVTVQGQLVPVFGDEKMTLSMA